MTRVRFIAPSSGGLLVTGARAALANALFARANKGHFAVRLPPGEDRITADLRWLGCQAGFSSLSRWLTLDETALTVDCNQFHGRN